MNNSSPTFRKTATESQIAFEVASLEWLRGAGDGAPVVPVLEWGKTWLLEPRLTSVRPTASQARTFGALLALTHAAGSDWYGQAPNRYDGQAWIGKAPLSLVEGEDARESWGSFYAAERIRPYLEGFTGSGEETLLSLCEKLESGSLDHPQPRLVKDVAARTHGDLWGGNVMWTEEGGVLIDPASSGGHAETDLAALGIFGAPHLGEIVSGYNDVSPLAPGWEDRVGLHQLHLLVVHAYLFGGGYFRQSVDVAAKYLR